MYAMKQTTRHYHVGYNTPGYSPETDAYMVRTKRDAIAAVASEVRQYREQEYDLPRTERRTASGSAKSGQVYFTRPNDKYDLGLVFWWTECNETDCAEDDDS